MPQQFTFHHQTIMSIVVGHEKCEQFAGQDFDFVSGIAFLYQVLFLFLPG
jgi:hypothetical protein